MIIDDVLSFIQLENKFKIFKSIKTNCKAFLTIFHHLHSSFDLFLVWDS